MFKSIFYLLLIISPFYLGAQSFDVGFKFENGDAAETIIGKRFAEKIFFEDTVRDNLSLNSGFYSCIKKGQILFDFMVIDKNQNIDYDFQTEKVEYDDFLNDEFFNNLKAVQDSPAYVEDLSGSTREIIKMFYPQIEVSQKQFKTHKKLINNTLVRALKYEDLLFNSPFLNQALDFVYGKCVSPDYDSSYFSCDMFLRQIKDENMYRYVLNWMLYNYETSKVLGSENVFIDLALNHLKPILTPTDTNGYAVLGKAESLNPNRMGSTARDFKFKDLSNGVIKNMHDVEGLFKIIFFYDPDCHHCKEVYPKAQALHDSILDRGVSFLAMSVDGNKKTIQEFKDEVDSNSSSVLFGYENEPGDFVGKYYIPVTPGIYILDANNRVKARGLSVMDLRELMKTFVGTY